MNGSTVLVFPRMRRNLFSIDQFFDIWHAITSTVRTYVGGEPLEEKVRHHNITVNKTLETLWKHYKCNPNELVIIIFHPFSSLSFSRTYGT